MECRGGKEVLRVLLRVNAFTNHEFEHNLLKDPCCCAVKVAVKNLELAPFLQVRQGKAFSRHAVDNSVLHAPQVHIRSLRELLLLFQARARFKWKHYG